MKSNEQMKGSFDPVGSQTSGPRSYRVGTLVYTKTGLFHETEHQELFYLQVDLHQPLAVHVPSALGPLGYFVCLRVPVAQAGVLGHVTVQARLTGLNSTDQTAQAGAGLDGQTSVPATTDGLVWVFLCRIGMARGDGVVTFSGVPADLGLVDLLFCTWSRYVTSGQADQWIAGQTDPNWAPSGVPLGGIGTGRVDLYRDGRFRHYSGNNNQDMPLEDPDGLPGAFLSVAVAGCERLLATRPAAGLPPCRTLHFEPAFPQAVLSAPDIFPGLDVAVTCSGPLIPHDLRTSSMPCALLRWRLVNRGARARTVRCRLAWPNLVGTGGGLGAPERRIGYGDGFYRFWEAPDAPLARASNLGGVRVLEYSNDPSPVSATANGRHYVAVQRGTRRTFVDADPRRGSVAQTVTVAPGGTADIRMALVWEMPHGLDSLGEDRGLHWQNHFTDGRAVLREIFASFDAILERTGSLRRLLAETDLPDWVQSRLLNCCYPLVTNSVFYRDGRFSINEGPTEMSGVFGTIDQRLAAHPATQLLFPELNRRELKQFAATMTANGEVNHDLGAGHLESPPRGQRWPDIQCSFALQHARHAWTTGDAKFETEAWPLVRRALERHAQWAEEGRGVPQLGRGTGLGTSYDSYHYEGTTAYIGTLWIAALQVAGKWAEAVGDHEFTQWAARWIGAARQRLDEDLWNGTFYRAYAGAGVASNENCHAGMLAALHRELLPGPAGRAGAPRRAGALGADRARHVRWQPAAMRHPADVPADDRRTLLGRLLHDRPGQLAGVRRLAGFLVRAARGGAATDPPVRGSLCRGSPPVLGAGPAGRRAAVTPGATGVRAIATGRQLARNRSRRAGAARKRAAGGTRRHRRRIRAFPHSALGTESGCRTQLGYPVT